MMSPGVVDRLREPGPWWWCLPACGAVGMATLVASRWVFSTTHPEYFETATGPTISRAAAFAESGTIFTVGMCVASGCAVMCWAVSLALRSDRSSPPALLRLARLAAGCGWIAAASLVGLAVIDSNTNGWWHERLSIAFFVSQIAAFWFERRWDRRAVPGAHVPVSERGARARQHKHLLTLGLCLASAVLLVLYLSEELGITDDHPVVEGGFVLVEYLVAFGCFAHPLASYRELKAHQPGAPTR